MKKTQTPKVAAVTVVEPSVHPLQKSYTIVSDRHVDYNNLTAFEAVSLSAVFVLAVIAGAVTSINV